MSMEEIEEWKDIEGYKNYEVSSFGKIRNKNTGRILKASINGGYNLVGLSNKKTNTFRVHTLVARAFILNPENKDTVNHKDKNGLNNNISNLEWMTIPENNKHRSNGVKQTTNQNIEIYRINPNTNEILEKYNSIEDGAKWIIEKKLSKNFHSARSSISSNIRKIYSSSFGFIWKIVEQNNLENEEWREVIINNKKTEGYYVSSLGRFKNKKGIIMKDYKPHHSGYIYVRVNKEKYALHRLVADTFIPNLENKPIPNHIDGIKTNNSVKNLEWATYSENNLHNHKVGLNKGHTRQIIQYDLEMNEIKKFDRIVDASKELNICYSSIKAVLYKKQNTAGGFIFRYLD
jgi:hypothetical protein